MKAGRELDALVTGKVMGMEPSQDGGYHRKSRKDTFQIVPAYSTNIAAAWLVVEKIHAGIDPAEMGPYQYLTLVCTGAFGEPWAASFDFNLSHDWYEADVIVSCPFAARSATPAHAICLAALKAVEVRR